MERTIQHQPNNKRHRYYHRKKNETPDKKIGKTNSLSPLNYTKDELDKILEPEKFSKSSFNVKKDRSERKLWQMQTN